MLKVLRLLSFKSHHDHVTFTWLRVSTRRRSRFRRVALVALDFHDEDMPAFVTPSSDVGKKRKLPLEETGLPQAKRQSIPPSGSASGYWIVQWSVIYVCCRTVELTSNRRNPQYKKHKTWDGDGVLVITGSSCQLLDTEKRKSVTLKFFCV